MNQKKQTSIPLPLQWVGPITIVNQEFTDTVMVPLATYESPLWPSTKRGARATVAAGGIKTVCIDDRMTRSIIVEASGAREAMHVVTQLSMRKKEMDAIAAATSRYVQLLGMHHQVVGNLLYLRFEMTTGDAAGHNMVTKAADALLSWIAAQYNVRYVSISGNFCTDKKVSAVNGILGRGKSVIAEIEIAAEIVQKYLKTTPEKIVDLHVKKNLIGSLLAGSIRSANAHFANMLLAFYLATGQDAANIVEGSQGIVHATCKDNNLYFSISLPNIIVGTVGNGKNLDFVQQHLEELGCLKKNPPGTNARRLACIACATVLCGELSLLAAQTNPGELVAAHMALERGQRQDT